MTPKSSTPAGRAYRPRTQFPLPHISFRRRVLRDLILCGRIAKKNPWRGLCDDAALILSILEARRGK